MPQINENIDELFRKAAEDYPLKTGAPDWEDMRKKLSSKNAAAGNSFRLQLLQQSVAVILFLLVPFVIANYSFKQNETIINNNSEHDSNHGKQALLSATSSERVVNNLQQDEQRFSVKNIFNGRHVVYQAGSVGQNIITKANTQKDLSLVFINSPVNITSAIMPQMELNAKSTMDIINTSDEMINTKKQAVIESSNKKRMFNITLSKPKNLYAGFMVSPELSNVKQQAFEKPGLNFGFLMGYNFSSRLQTEVAVIKARKYYHTDGKYAEPNSIRHDESQITGINVFCSVTEIPVTVHYTFNDNGNSKFFASAGTVSNIVHRERYNYEYKKNGEERDGFKKYNKSVENLFSNIQLSAGYEKKIGTIGTIRIEPYYRIPLNGIGRSNLPVTSTGINIGLIKYFK